MKDIAPLKKSMSREEAYDFMREVEFSCARKIPDSLKCLGDGGWKLQKTFRETRTSRLPVTCNTA